MNRALTVLFPALLLAGCASAPPASPAPAFDAVAVVAAIRAAGAEGEELVIRPLGDTEVVDLREQAARLEASGAYTEAAAALDQALAISPEDPALLQERAEIAVLERDLVKASELAQRAVAAGSMVGPLCRRHWETIAQARIAQARAVQATVADAPRAPLPVDAARQRRDACTVAAPKRF